MRNFRIFKAGFYITSVAKYIPGERTVRKETQSEVFLCTSLSYKFK